MHDVFPPFLSVACKCIMAMLKLTYLMLKKQLYYSGRRTKLAFRWKALNRLNFMSLFEPLNPYEQITLTMCQIHVLRVIWNFAKSQIISKRKWNRSQKFTSPSNDIASCRSKHFNMIGLSLYLFRQSISSVPTVENKLSLVDLVTLQYCDIWCLLNMRSEVCIVVSYQPFNFFWGVEETVQINLIATKVK